MTEVTLKGNPIRISGTLPSKGSKAPDFLLVDGDLNERSLKDYKGKRKLISIVPSLDTSVCSLSTKKFNEKIKADPQLVALVVSADLPFAQKRMCSAENVANVIPLSMMRNKDFAKSYGVLIESGPLAGICARAVVVLDENDQIVYTQLVPEIAQEPDYDKALEALLKK
ncbi:MAG: thiol peroxidase [Verrucomicrobia bacterium]|nr:thiol peroxidase [Verrucomicrobiota bacterium]